MSADQVVRAVRADREKREREAREFRRRVWVSRIVAIVVAAVVLATCSMLMTH